jgi:hypothetical protein
MNRSRVEPDLLAVKMNTGDSEVSGTARLISAVVTMRRAWHTGSRE